MPSILSIGICFNLLQGTIVTSLKLIDCVIDVSQRVKSRFLQPLFICDKNKPSLSLSFTYNQRLAHFPTLTYQYPVYGIFIKQLFLHFIKHHHQLKNEGHTLFSVQFITNQLVILSLLLLID
jgi:hypothetical protein